MSLKVSELQSTLYGIVSALSYFADAYVVAYDGTQYDEVQQALADEDRGVAVLVMEVLEEVVVGDTSGILSVDATVEVRVGINPHTNATGAGLTLEGAKGKIISAVLSTEGDGGLDRWRPYRGGLFVESIGREGETAVAIRFTRNAERGSDDT